MCKKVVVSKFSALLSSLVVFICVLLFSQSNQVLASVNYYGSAGEIGTLTLEQEWNLQPKNIQDMMTRLGVNIFIVDDVSYKIPNYLTLAITQFQYDVNTKIVVGPPRMEINKLCQCEFTHEIGHVISSSNGILFYWCDQPGFQTICSSEGRNYPGITEYYYNDPREFFAFGYDKFIHDPASLKTYCPMTFDYISNVVKITS